jgi:hypothetical protein
MSFCISCGAKLQPEWSHCPRCGGAAFPKIQPKQGKAGKIIFICILVFVGMAFLSSLRKNHEDAINAQVFRCPLTDCQVAAIRADSLPGTSERSKDADDANRAMLAIELHDAGLYDSASDAAVGGILRISDGTRAAVMGQAPPRYTIVRILNGPYSGRVVIAQSKYLKYLR